MKICEHVYHGKKLHSGKVFHKKSMEKRNYLLKGTETTQGCVSSASITTKSIARQHSPETWLIKSEREITIFSLCNTQSNSKIHEFLILQEILSPSHGVCHKHSSSSQKSALSIGVCHWHDDTCFSNI